MILQGIPASEGVGLGRAVCVRENMICGPLGGWCIKRFDKAAEGRVPAGFEMVVNNFSVGIIGALLAILSIFVIGPVCVGLTTLLGAGVNAELMLTPKDCCFANIMGIGVAAAAVSFAVSVLLKFFGKEASLADAQAQVAASKAAAKGEEHLEVLGRIVGMASTDEDTDGVVAGADMEALYRKLNGLD